jgi:hypothetical protein
MLKKYEPRFELEEAFTPGVRGRADPRFSVTRAERLRLLAVRKRDNLGIVSVHESFEDIFDHVREDGAEADPRINWRVTARHGDYYIYIMALDQGLSRFACCLQKTSEFEEGLRSYGRCLSTRYEAGNLAEIEHVLDDIYARLKHEDEQRRQQDEQRRQQDRIDKEVQKAVEKEREIWRDHLARSRAKRLQVIGLCVLALPVLAALVFPRFEQLFTLVFVAMILVAAGYSIWKAQKRNDEINRTANEQRNREAKAKAEADERYRIYQENYKREGKALKKRVLDDLKAIGRGEKDWRRTKPRSVSCAYLSPLAGQR